MEEKINPNQEREKFYKNNNLISFLRFLLYILLVVGLGLIAVNQGIGYFYKSRFLQTPCELCKELNQKNESPIYNIGIQNITIFLPEEFPDTS